ncbi:hypothetical protein [Bacillus altitudinis]|uniref:hypothetical protein n=1 Tax=Bacillus altitudinis TaxID=293387 RepID=UPI002020E110|nr:hypothetical protein [Bacillus altitudinis]MBW3700582.1 hypothetical protein [Bacillus aerophilus]MCL7871033.1 hypothetical protein [Bacillus altitudinis]WOQ71400.1 hypothetical protein R0126_11925 [Bacillus stratosphericus]
MTGQTLRINEYVFRISSGIDPMTGERIDKEAYGYFKANLIKKNIAQVGSRKIDFSNEITVGFDAFGEETKKQINDHLLAVYRLVAAGAEEYGLEED